jgi:hypothetical protein
VKGLIKKAKVKNMTLDASMEEWHKDNILNFDHHKVDWQKVKKVWMDWTNANKQSLKKFS